MTLPQVAKPEWLDDAFDSMERLSRLRKAGRIPDKILGWVIVVDCMRMLRAVYGSDLYTAAAIRARVLEAEQRWLDMGDKGVPK